MQGAPHGRRPPPAWRRTATGPYPPGRDVDPTGPGAGTHRVIRGGSWDYDARIVHAAYRDRYAPGGRDEYLGFRLARGLP